MLLAEAISAGWQVEAQFVAPQASPVAGAEAAPVLELAEGVLERVATTEAPRDVIAIVRRRATALPADATFVVVCAQVADPGNLGTIVRSAEAAGADAVVCTPGCVDAWSPKTVRASAGAVFHVPVVELPTSLDGLRALRLTLVGSSSHPGHDPVDHTASDLTRPVAIVMGNEAHGIPADVAVDEWVRIAHAGRSESLNVAMAATVLCFEVSRQRRAAAGTLPG